MTTWGDSTPQRPVPGTEPRSAWPRFFEALGFSRDPEPEVTHRDPCDRAAGSVISGPAATEQGTTHIDMRPVEKDGPVNTHPGPDLPPREKKPKQADGTGAKRHQPDLTPASRNRKRERPLSTLPTRAQLDAAEARTATVMSDPSATPWQRMLAADQEMQAGTGLRANDYEPEAAS
jgi:hypothetical protein